MEKSEVIEIIKEYIENDLEVGEDEDLTEDVNLFENGFLDSLDAMTLTAYLEGRFNIEITQKDLVLYSMTSIDEIADVIMEKL